jgi:hypothetical protein
MKYIAWATVFSAMSSAEAIDKVFVEDNQENRGVD